MTFTLAICGRPNVGKSTLFNKLAGRKLAIVHDKPGVTRDWREADGEIAGRKLKIIDTAGLEDVLDQSLEARMRGQTEAALERADAILFVIDAREGLTELDKYFAKWLRKQDKPVILAANKCENQKTVDTGLGEAYRLGLGTPIPMSAEHGHGFDLLYDMLEEHWDEEDESERQDDMDPDFDGDIDDLEGDEEFDFATLVEEEEDTRPIKIAIVGRPNAGKSTLFNRLLEEERMLTGPEAGITRDAITAEWEYKGRQIRLVDTAGMRKKAKIIDNLEKMSVDESLRAIRLAQVVILMVDAQTPLEKQDLSIGQMVSREGRALIVCINKWDLIDEKANFLEEMKYRLSKGLSQVENVQTMTISALTGKNINKLMDSVLHTYALWNKRVSTGKLNRWLDGMERAHPAPLVQGRPNRLRYITQIKTRPPTFAIWVSRPESITESYKRYLVNGIREAFNIPSVPIRLLVRTSKNPYHD